MKQLILMILIVSPFTLQAQKVHSLSKVMELKMPKRDKNNGTNGASVVYNPKTNKYYASFAGNAKYPLAVFNSNGKQISDDQLNGMVDMRGMWYNRTLKTICGKVHGQNAWFSYELSRNGIPISKEIYVRTDIKSQNQSIGAYYPKKDRVYLLDGQYVIVYDANGEEIRDARFRLYTGVSNKNDIDDTQTGRRISANYNDRSLIYTGIRKAEFGILNYRKKQIELYNKKNGLLTQILKLPKNIKTYRAFNFSYTDGIFWLYDQRTRTWLGFE